VRAEQSSHEGNPLDVVKGREQEIGPLLGIFTIVILLAAGAFYFWMNEFKESKRGPQATTTEVIVYQHAPAATSTSTNASSSDAAELDAMQNNLENQTKDVNNLNF
jgi:hypothetical protein